MSVSKEDLFKRRVKEVDVEIPDVGTIRVRALTRTEVLSLGVVPGQGAELDLAEAERKVISAGMVEPPMTQDDVKAWQDSSPAVEINAVFLAIVELSGLTGEMPKEMVKQFPS